MYQKRTYRKFHYNDGLVSFQVLVKETDLYIKAEKDLSAEAKELVLNYRSQIEEYILRVPEFQASLVPVSIDPFAPKIIQTMMEGAIAAGVGPMAAVAGSISEFVGKELLKQSAEVIVENGGDIFLKTLSEVHIGIHAGDSPLSNKIGIKISPDDTPLGVATSSGTVGHSLSFGKADAVTVLSGSTPLADAVATSIGNRIQKQADLNKGLDFARNIDGVMGVAIILGDEIAVWGKMELLRL